VAAADCEEESVAGAGRIVLSRDAARRARPLIGRSRVLAPLYALYTHRLRLRVAAEPRPHHVAVILDGNRRWASALGLRDPGAGHRQGADKLVELIAWCELIGIAELTVWGLSNENLERAASGREALIDVLNRSLPTLAESKAGRPSRRIRVFGRLETLPPQLAETARAVEASTKANEGLHLNVALGYSGRDELVDATRALIGSLVDRGVPPELMAEQVDAETIERHLYTAGHSDPDLIVRTSGEMRLSGFLPWQSSWSEFYFADVYWPAFRELDFLRAVRTYQQRKRRFGH
jgi:short-chain Z-isoprenyl diphosphate synthase